MKRRLLLALSALALTQCDHNPSTPTDDVESAQQPLVGTVEIDPVADPPANVSLLVLTPGFDRARLVDVLEDKLGGVLFTEQGTRLAIAQLPKNADGILSQLGVQAHYERAVDPRELDTVTTEEQRFINVFDSRYYPEGTPEALLITPKRAVKQLPEGPPSLVAVPKTAKSILPPGRILPPVQDPTITTPFASGTVVVSVLLPQSNGRAEPSTERWTDELIQETYAKVQNALEAYVRTEPNAKLRFIVHYESAPAAIDPVTGQPGLTGTIESDYECGQHWQINTWEDEVATSAPLLARLLGHDVAADTQSLFDASYEYLNNLRARYNAEAAYYIKVAPNTTGAAGLRAHAFINGPSFTIDSSYGFDVFMHEGGHVFGALDEYCNDICPDPTALTGYLGMSNANGISLPGRGGIDHGQGENQQSLMQYNIADAVNGYTRGTWGWIDSDGDGRFDVRNTFPTTRLAATVTGNQLSVTGYAMDLPEQTLTGTRQYSVNRIVALEYRLADPPRKVLAADGTDATDADGTDGTDATDGADAIRPIVAQPWFSLPVERVNSYIAPITNLALGAFPAGEHTIELRSRNSVGNVDAKPQVVTFTVPDGASANTAPRARVDASPTVGSVRTRFKLSVTATDYDLSQPVRAGAVQTRLDTDGDGLWDTPFANDTNVSATFAKPGIYHVIAEARDRSGASTLTRTDVYVLDGNAPPAVTLTGAPSMLFGQATATPTFTASGADPDGDAVQYNWIVDSATNDDDYHSETGFSARSSFTATLATPQTVDAPLVDLSVGDPALPKGTAQPVVSLGGGVVAAGWPNGYLLVTDLSDPEKPLERAALALEAPVEQLAVSGTSLYALGGSSLTVVDVSDPRAPVERKQALRKPTHTFSATPSLAIPDEDKAGVTQTFSSNFGERLTGIELDYEVVHQRPAQLTFLLSVTTRDGSSQLITLRDQESSAGGDKTYIFTDQTNKDLAALLGSFDQGAFGLTVVDNVSGTTGTFKKAKLILKTQSRAFATLESGTLVGVLSGQKVVVAGAGLQVVNAATPTALKVLSSLTGTVASSGVLYDSAYALVSSAPRRTTADARTTTHGLYVVDLTRPASPSLERAVDTFGDAGTLSLVGTRAYLAGGKSTMLLDGAAFVRGAASYTLGTIPTLLTQVFGSASLVWGTDGLVQRWDVSTPSAPKRTQLYTRPGDIRGIAPLDATHFVLWNLGEVRIANLNAPLNILSRVFRVTLQARDSQGAITSVTRTVHVVPYDHAPAVTGQVVSGETAEDLFQIRASVTDLDQGQPWDLFQWVRADLDGDGVYDTQWDQPSRDYNFLASFPGPGTYTINLQTRDMFYALGSSSLTITVK